MTAEDTYKKLFEIQVKIEQVLRIQSKLETRKINYISEIKKNENRKDQILACTKLLKVYKREKKVLFIITNGLNEIEPILNEIKSDIFGLTPIWQRIKIIAINKIPLRKKTPTEELSIIARGMFKLLISQLAFVEANLADITREIEAQEDILFTIKFTLEDNKLKEKTIQGSALWKDLMHHRKLENEIVELIESSSKTGVIMKGLKTTDKALKQNPTLARIQAVNMSWPMNATLTGAASMAFGVQFAPLFYVLAQFIKYSPAIAAGVNMYRKTRSVTA